MFKHFFMVPLITLLAISTIQAETYWLNIPGHYSKVDGQLVPSLSLPTPSHDKCSDAIIEYAKTNLVYYIGCDVKPLRDAVNLKEPRKRR